MSLGFELQDAFSLTQPLSLFAVEFLPQLLKKYGRAVPPVDHPIHVHATDVIHRGLDARFLS